MPTLNWIGKKAVENHHRQVPFRLLKDVPELSVGDPGTGNLIVEGDNLLALKALLPYYAGQVKCIYIDPPYNTGNENWVYNDNVSSPEMRDWLGKTVGDEAEDLTRHDKWLCMILPRLRLLYKFLREDGAIVVHIDENEIDHAHLILSEVFGRENSLGYIVWDKGNPKGDSQGIAFQHETLYVFAKSKKIFCERNKLHIKKANAERILQKAKSLFKNIGKDLLPEDLKEIIKKYSLDQELVKKHIHQYTIDEANTDLFAWMKKRGISGGELMYNMISQDGRVYRLVSMAWPNKKKAPEEYFLPLVHPKTQKKCPIPVRGWRYPPKTMELLLKAGLIQFGEDNSTQPQRIYYLDENLSQNLSSIVFFAGSDDALFRDLSIDFENPKPVKFAADIIDVFTENDSIIMDSFAGSGTTAHAVLQLNKQDEGTRKFILVEMDQKISRTITSERVRHVIQGYKTKKGELVEGLGGGFRYCQLGEPLFDEKGNIRNTVKFQDLARHVFFTETGEPLPKGAKANSPLIGLYNGTAVYLLYNGILKDKAPEGGNVLTTAILAQLPKHAGPKVVYGTACRIGQARLNRENITFKQLPYKLKVDAL